jgi:hypothetical protein
MSNYAPVSYTGNGVLTDFVVPFPYLDKTHVIATVNGFPAVIASWPSAGVARLAVAPALGVSVTLSRNTAGDQLVTHQAGSIKIADLNKGYRQAIYLGDEAKAAYSTLTGIIETISDGVANFFTVPYVGAIARYIRDRFGEELSVTDFGAVPNNSSAGVMTANTAAFNLICTYTSRPKVPAGDFWINGNLTSFLTVEFQGEGAIKRTGGAEGVITWTPTPGTTNTNTLYASATGSDANDGLSSDKPVLTIQKVVDKVTKRKGSKLGKWVIQLAAGTFTNQDIKVSYWASQGNDLYIQGPSVGVNVQPTAILNGASASSDTGITINTATYVRLLNIEFKNFTDTQVQGAASSVFLTNVWATGGKQGYYWHTFCYWDAIGGIINGSTIYGILELFHIVRRTTGAEVLDGGGNVDLAASRARGIQIKNCAIAFRAKEHCTGHLQYCVLTDNTSGVSMSRSCTANMDGIQIYRTTKCAIDLKNGSFAVYGAADLGLGTGNANGRPWKFDRTSGFVANESNDPLLVSDLSIGIGGSGIEYMGSFNRDPGTPFTATSSTVIATLGTHPAGSFVTPGALTEMDVVWRKGGAGAGTATLSFQMGSSVVGSSVIPANATKGNTNFKFFSLGPSSQFLRMTTVHNGTGTVVLGDATSALTLEDANDHDVKLAGLVTATDNLLLDGMWLRSSERRAIEHS